MLLETAQGATSLELRVGPSLFDPECEIVCAAIACYRQSLSERTAQAGRTKVRGRCGWSGDRRKEIRERRGKRERKTL